VSQGWKTVSLDEICDIARGGSPRPIKEFITDAADGVNWIKIGDATASNKYIYKTKQKIKREGIQRSRFVKAGDFLLSNSMSFGRPYIMKTSGCIHDGWLVLSDKSGAFNQDYLYYFLGSNAAYKQFDELAAGSTVRNLNIGLVKRVKVLLPALPEQQRIVSILDKAFKSIDQAIANTEKNLANARELFESYLNNVFTQKGEGWVEVSLSDVCQLISGQHIDSKDYNIIEKGIGYLTGPSDFGLINPVVSKWTEHPKRTALLNDILVTVKGSGVGKANLMTHGELAISRQLMAIRSNEVNIKLLYRFIKTRYSYFQSLANGAAIPGISRPDVLGLTLSLPKRSLQNELAIKIDSIANEVDNLDEVYKKKIFSLNELKQSLLQKAFSGQLS